MLLFKWKRSFEFKNISKYNAKNLKILWPPNLPHIDLSFEPNFFLRAFDETEKKVIVEKYVSYDDLEGHKKDRFKYFMPKELKNIAFILCYENEFGKKYYIRYKRDKEQELIDNKPKMLKPKFKNEFSL